MINITLGVGLPALVFCCTEFLKDFHVDDYIKIAQREANRYCMYVVTLLHYIWLMLSILLPCMCVCGSLFLLTCLLLVVILTYMAVIAPFLEMFRSFVQALVQRCRVNAEREVEGGTSRSTCMPEYVTLTYVGATIQILVFIAVYAVFISANEMTRSWWWFLLWCTYSIMEI